MPEAYTCLCGHQKFSIYGGYVNCLKCAKEYRVATMETPNKFNKRICSEEKEVHSRIKPERMDYMDKGALIGKPREA